MLKPLDIGDTIELLATHPNPPHYRVTGLFRIVALLPDAQHWRGGGRVDVIDQRGRRTYLPARIALVYRVER